MAVDALAPLISFLRFVARVAPHLAPELHGLCERWCGERGIPVAEVLPALKDTLTPAVAAADAETDAVIDKYWPQGEN